MTASNPCTRCGASLAPGAHFCSRCGFDVSGEQGGLATKKVAPSTEADPQAELLEELRRATLGEYDIAAELGRGGMATVFQAHEIALDRKVAIKVMSPALLQGGRGMADRFKREARTSAKLSHPHIIPIYGVRESGRLLFFIMKFVNGRSLDAIVKEHGALPIKMVQAILSQVGGALDYAHHSGVFHRDIKPANIMLDTDGWAVVTDFGIAKVTEAQGLTMTGATIGTPTYMSPEQCAAREITGATDQYSLGIAAYEMLTGKVPFDADSVMSLMWQHFHEPPPPILDRRPDCPPELARAVERMLAKAPADRWPSLEESIEAIGTPPHNDPIRREMKALARGGDASRITDHHTPVSPVPKQTPPPTPQQIELPSTPIMPIPPAPPPAVTGAPTTPIPATPTPAEFAAAPTAVVSTPPPPSSPAPPAPPKAMPPQPPPAPPAAPPRSRPSGVSPAIARPTPAATPVPPPFSPARPARVPRWVSIAAVLAVTGVAAWALLGRKTVPPPPPPPDLAAPVASVAVTPSPAALAVGQRAQLTAVLKDGRGNVLKDREVKWTSSDSTMAQISSTGLVTGLAPGYINVMATSEGHNGTGTVIVTATVVPVASVEITPGRASVQLGDTASLSAAPKDARGNTLSGHAVTWSSSDRAVVAVTTTGTVTALGEGTAVITAVVEGTRATAQVTVTPPAVAIVTVTPSTVSVQVGARTQLSVSARDARGVPITGRGVLWTSSDRDVATVTAGEVTGVAPGEATISARVESQGALATVTVTAIPVARVSVTPARPTVAVGKTVQLSASAHDARGAVLENRAVQWSSSNESVATVSQTGTVTGVAGGTATISATSEGTTGNASVTIPTPPPPVVVGDPTPPPPPVTKPGAQPVESQPIVAPPPPVGAATGAATSPRRGPAAGGSHSCGITQSGAAVCWGHNANGQLGDASAGAQIPNPIPVAHPASFTALVAGENHTCGLTTSGTAVCWGLNTRGQLGTGRTAGAPTPAPVAGNRQFIALTAGARHTCGLGSDGVAWCWGDNSAGQLGDGSTRGANAPRRVSGATKFRALAAGSDHTCGLSSDGRVFCWGDGFSGQLGRGARESQPEPVPIESSLRFTALASGGKHTCALAEGGKLYCWGANAAGEIGDGSKSERAEPVLVARGGPFVMVAAGTDHTCGLTDGGDAFCWGRNRDGQLGDGTRADRPAPVKVASAASLRAISAGGTHTCGVTREQEVVCWGSNGRGQLGDGTLTGRPTPAAVEAGAGRP